MFTIPMQALFKSNVAGRFVCLLVLLAILVICPVRGECGKIETRLDFTLPVPVEKLHQHYLGKFNADRFHLGQIDADLVIIEIFSMYCPICQREASNINRLYNLIQDTPHLKKRVKLIGIGAGNSGFEVDFFKEKYGIKFPLFSDPDFVIHKKINEVRTPHFFGLLMDDDSSFRVIFSKSVDVSDPEAFLNLLLKQAGIPPIP